jgi:hypothetical protein
MQPPSFGGRRPAPLAVLARQGKFCGRIEGTAATGFTVDSEAGQNAIFVRSLGLSISVSLNPAPAGKPSPRTCGKRLMYY